jgi:mitogen-activated protein kinase 15
LQALRGNCNIVSLFHVIRADNDKDIYLLFEYLGNYPRSFLTLPVDFIFFVLLFVFFVMHLLCFVRRILISRVDTDLSQVIKSNILEESHKRYIVLQVLTALRYMHANGILHRDVQV